MKLRLSPSIDQTDSIPFEDTIIVSFIFNCIISLGPNPSVVHFQYHARWGRDCCIVCSCACVPCYSCSTCSCYLASFTTTSRSPS